MLKTEEEVALIATHVSVTCGAIALVHDILVASNIEEETVMYKDVPLTSEYLHQIVLTYLNDRGYTTPEGLIISSGKDSAEPHHEGQGIIRVGTPIVVDIYPKHIESGWYADVTRTFVKGEPSSQLRGMYEAVSSAKAAAFKALKPGVAASELYQISAEVLEQAGFKTTAQEGYLHSLGHGLGSEVHEAPKLGPSDQTVIEAGMVLTIEPGLYYLDIGGVRLEDTVVVTADGYRNLTLYNSPWIIL